MRLVWDRIGNTGYSMVGVVWVGYYDVGGVVVGVWILCCGRGSWCEVRPGERSEF